jgi:hypothetical protein
MLQTAGCRVDPEAANSSICAICCIKVILFFESCNRKRERSAILPIVACCKGEPEICVRLPFALTRNPVTVLGELGYWYIRIGVEQLPMLPAAETAIRRERTA